MSPRNFSEIRLSRIAAEPIVNGIGETSDIGEPTWPRYIRITDIRGLDELKSEERMSLPPTLAAKAKVERDDIVMAAVGATVGDAYIHQSDAPACFAGYLVRFRADRSLAHPRFVAHWTQSSHYRHQIRSGYVGSTIENFSASKYRAMRIPLPALSVQREISRFLDRETAKIDALIAKQNQLIATLREDRAATITHAITRGLSSGAEFVESGIAAVGEYPNGWTLGRLKLWISRIESGTSVNAADAPASLEELGILKTSCVYTGNFDAAENKTIFPEESDRVSCPLRPGTLIVSRMNTPELVGSAGYVDDAPANLYLPDRLWQVSFRDALAEWFAYWSKTSAYRGQLKSVCVGTSSSMQNISQGDYGSLLLAVPPVEEQRKIVKFLDSRCANIESLVEKSTQMIAGLREYRSALITNAVTGKIDVREAV